MRIVVASAHYPPNFVSGGTLQPQRLARALRVRGHAVSVYAGWLGPSRRPGEAWDDADETGLPVRWIATTPWTGWADPRNFDNPAIAADFAAHLERVRPEVVHVHALQSLGAGIVGTAADAGARVVVTMHDFWWCCARQFLVARDLAPCCLVVDAGTCACEVDRPWLDARNAVLRRQLGRADLVLAPSASAAAVLAANGIGVARLRVDENGLPPPPAGEAAAPPSADELRLLYVGGPSEMKGVHVLLDAARELAGRPGWRLAAHGVEPYLRRTGRSLGPLPVDVRPPFSPADADAVYAGAAVLVVPSVMRESFSIATREALGRGVPVVCTDSLGPEEVVRHGENGLVVPAADPVALAAALRRLLDEPELLGRLRRNTEAVPVRSIDDQADGLEATFRELVAGDGRAAPPVPTVRRVLFVCGIEGAPLRYRAHLPAEALALRGVASEVRHYRDPELDALVTAADAVVVYRVPATVQVLGLLGRARARGVPVVFDVDDLIFDPDLAPEIPALSLLPPDEAALWLQGVRRYRTTMELCDAFVGSTAALCRHATAVTGLPAERFDNGVGLVLARTSDVALGRPRSPGPLRLGYLSGTNTHDRDWAHVEPAVRAVLERHPEAELWLGGPVRTTAALEPYAARVRRLPFQPWLELPGVLRDLDVNLAPLEPGSRFNEAKSAIKWLEAALTATPTVASPTEPFREAVRHGENGLLAGDVEEWTACLERLVADAGLRARLGRRARRDALLGWSPHLQADRYLEILARAAERARQGPAVRETSWVPVALDEPPLPIALEPYAAPAAPAGAPAAPPPLGQLVRRVPALAARGWVLWRTAGPAATTRAAARFARRRAGPVAAELRRRASPTATPWRRSAGLAAGRLRRWAKVARSARR